MRSILILALVLCGCATNNFTDVNNQTDLESVLDTKITNHALAFPLIFEYDGIVVGFEKSDVNLVCNAGSCNRPIALPYAASRNPGQKQHYSRVMHGNSRAIYVSHIYEFTSKPKTKENGAEIPKSVELQCLYNIYAASMPSRCASQVNIEKSLMENSFDQIDKVKNVLNDKIQKAKLTNNPYSHILVMSTGWNNVQHESFYFYNSLLRNLTAVYKAEDKSVFNPLVIGFTWDSVWGERLIPPFNSLMHIVSYPNKADDADEVGYGLANYVVNKAVMSVKGKGLGNGNDLPVIVLGHSFGARMLSRALASKDYLAAEEVPEQKVDLFLGLQPAFDAHRFLSEKPGCMWWFLCINKILPGWHESEGGPYQNYSDLADAIVVTTSSEDTANPLAKWVTGANHLGGKVGLKQVLENEGTFTVHRWVVESSDNATVTKREMTFCEGLKKSDRSKIQVIDGSRALVNEDSDQQYAVSGVLGVVEAKDAKAELKLLLTGRATQKASVENPSLISGHNDVIDMDMGRIMYCAIKVFES